MFWLYVVLSVIGGGRNAYRTGTSYALWSGPASILGGVLDVAISLAGGALVFALLPAALRKLTYLSRDKKAWKSVPEDVSAGWRTDPAGIAEQRWWTGSQWSAATVPEKRPGTAYLWIVAGVALVLVLALFAGRASAQSEGSTAANATGNSPNVALMVSTSFNGLADSLQAYLSIPIDPNAPMANILDVKNAFDKVETNYLELSGALRTVRSQGELGSDAPDLQRLREFVATMAPYIKTRKDYYAALEACSPITTQRVASDCDIAAFEVAEKPMVDTIQPVSDAWDAVLATVPKASGTE